MIVDLKLVPLTTEQNKDIDFCQKVLLGIVSKAVEDAEKVKSSLSAEGLVSMVYLKIFAACLKEQKFENLEEAWRYMNDIRGIIEKVWYVSSYIDNVNQSILENSQKVK